MNTKTPAAAGRLARDHVVLKRAAASEFLQICWTIECHGQCHTDRGRWLRGMTWVGLSSAMRFKTVCGAEWPPQLAEGKGNNYYWGGRRRADPAVSESATDRRNNAAIP